MKKLYIIIAFLLLALMACNKASNPANSSDRNISLVAANNNFAIKLFKEVNTEDNNSNLFISPLSLSIALGMTNNGAAGTTRDDIFKTLEQNGTNIDSVNKDYLSLDNQLPFLDPAVQFNIANSIWYKQGFNFETSFFNTCQNYFNSTVQSLDFNNPASVGTINDWVSNKTYGKIPTIIDNIDPSSVMFLINALYFKANWANKFDSAATFSGSFYLDNQHISYITCQMLNTVDAFNYAANSQEQIIRLAYSNGAFSMLIILPMQGVNIDDIISGLNIDEWNGWLGALMPSIVNLTIPKFKFDYSIKLKTALTNFGMGIAFDANNANFSNMSLTDKLYISYVLQKTYIGVGEQGTEAAAVTITGINHSSQRQADAIMTINNPFIFVIYDNVSNSIEFMGKVESPGL